MLKTLHESVVQESEIDSLGHMNVRFYLERVARANESLLAEAGVHPDAGQAIRRTDVYSQFRREQFSGARLHTLGGLIATECGAEESLSAYFEIRNPDTEDLAATFIVTSNLVELNTQKTLGIPVTGSANTDPLTIEIPDYGRPRSLSLVPPREVALAEIEAVISDEPTPGMMSGRREGIVHEEDCDANGRLREDVDTMFVLHRPDPNTDLKEIGPPHLRDSHGRLYSWAMMETRSLVYAKPVAGETIVSLGADVAFGEKWRQSRRWMYAKSSGELLSVHDSVGVCIDLEARRAIPIPEEMHDAIEENYLPDLI